jgi:hypothetical protein
MILRIPKNFIFPLTTFAFVAIPVDYVDIVFTTTTRWVFLVTLTLYLLARRRLFLGMQNYAGIALLLYCAWCLSTYSWSLVPRLSFEKAAAFSLLAVAFVSAGQDWIHERGAHRALNFLAPITVVGLLAAVGGRVATGHVGPGAVSAIEGLTDNPNMLGSLIAMTLPLLLWSAYKYRAQPQARWIFFLLLAVAVVLLARTHSRSSILSAGMLAFVFCLSLTLPRSTFILLLIASSLLVAAAASTAVFDIAYEDYVMKGGTQQEGVLYSRIGVWRQSYENAEEGGWFGLGYGATAGDTYFQGGFTSVGYGREKGNTQLAIVEETGVVGLGLYCLLLLGLFAPLIRAHRRERNPDMKVALGITIGALVGVTAMSVFEAWWVSPGSAESAYFWSVAGVGLALARKSRQRAGDAASAQPFIRGPVLSSAAAFSERRARG